MQGRGIAWVGILTIFLFGSAAEIARASGLPPRYQLVDLGPASRAPGGGFPRIANDGTISTGPFEFTAGRYTSGLIFNTQQPWKIDANYLRKAGSDMNLLPASVANPSTIVYGISPNGEAVGVLPGGKGYYFDSETGELLTPTSLSGTNSNSYFPIGLNSLHQMVGNQDGSAILYMNPITSPLALDTLVLNLDLWHLMSATSINDLGQIVGVGYRSTTYDYRYFRLDPVPVPEPATWLAFAAIGGILVRRYQNKTPVRSNRRCL